jgi:2-desacetyl-2-hydroxyethyl bacteriochlorophyllide A dehydrogenase
MKAAVIEDGKIDVRDMPEPQAGPNQIKVKIAYCGVCGSELHMYDPEYTSRRPLFPAGPGPRVMGHEASGTIVEIGKDVKSQLKVGQKVAMNFRSYCGNCYYCQNGMEHYCQNAVHNTGSYAEYAVYNDGAVYPLPEGVSLEVGALLEPVSVAVHTIDIARIKPGGTMAILGSGPIGLLIQMVAAMSGAAKILVSEPIASRREMARKMGATVVVDPLNEDLEAACKKLTDGRGFDTVIECSGKLAVANQAVFLADNCGTVIWAAMYPNGAEVGVQPHYMYQHELTIKSVFVSPYAFTRALNLLPVLDLEPLISIKPLEKIDEAFHELLAGKGIKVLMKP